jgi:hypothetical protein
MAFIRSPVFINSTVVLFYAASARLWRGCGINPAGRPFAFSQSAVRPERYSGFISKQEAAMSTIRYGCFFSYAHGRHPHMIKFKNDLAEALKCYLEPHFDNESELFIDTEQLGGRR